MASQSSTRMSSERIRGWIFLFTWAALIAAGIVAKRMFGHPDLMVFFHLPAGVFLVMAAHALSGEVRRQYRESLNRIDNERSNVRKNLKESL